MPNLKRWVDLIANRPAAQRGIIVPAPIKVDKTEFIKGARTLLT